MFDRAVRRGVESPWERIRAIQSRTKTPLGMALRGRFLVGSRPVGGDFVRRFVASAGRERHRGLPAARPAQRRLNLREAGEAIVGRGGELDAGLVYSPGPTGETDALVEQASKLPELGAARPAPRSVRLARAAPRSELVERDRRGERPPDRDLLPGARRGTRWPRRSRPREPGPTASRAPSMPSRSSSTASRARGSRRARGLGLASGVDIEHLWRASDLVDQHIGDEPVTPLAPRIAVRAAQHNLPAGLVAALDAHLRAQATGDRLDEVLDELERIRGEAGWPPLAAPIGQILGSQALIHVLSASRYRLVVDELRGLFEGDFGEPPASSTRMRAARSSA